jgi:hypothetical protein
MEVKKMGKQVNIIEDLGMGIKLEELAPKGETKDGSSNTKNVEDRK